MNVITGLPISETPSRVSPILFDESPRVLVVDDEPAVREPVMGFLREFYFHPVGAKDGLQALELARKENFDVAVVDLSMPGISGLETIRRLKAISPHTQIIILTGAPSLESSLAAIDEQVFAYLCKPPSPGVLAKAVQRASEHVVLARQNRELIGQLEYERNKLKNEVEASRLAMERRLIGSPEFIGQSAALEDTRRMIAMVAPSDLTVLIQGESGTGKEVVARLIGELSGRNSVSGFIKINCPAIPESLLESELFGHEAGAFTGAQKHKPGRLELAPNGTVFLDEIGDMPMTLQAKLLQFIESKQFFRLGGTKTITVNTRLVAATNAPLEQMVEAGSFRRDLFFRLSEYRICLPPLRERAEDIPLLLEHFIKKYTKHIPRRSLPRLAPSTLEHLAAYPWPGNVREFESLIRRFVLTADQETLINHGTPEGIGNREQGIVGQAASQVRQAALPASSGTQSTQAPQPASTSNPNQQPADSWQARQPAPPSDPSTSNVGNTHPPDHQTSNSSSPAPTLRERESQAILNVLNQCAWNRRRAAEALGISYATLRRKITLHNLKPNS